MDHVVCMCAYLCMKSWARRRFRNNMFLDITKQRKHDMVEKPDS